MRRQPSGCLLNPRDGYDDVQRPQGLAAVQLSRCQIGVQVVCPLTVEMHQTFIFELADHP